MKYIPSAVTRVVGRQLLVGQKHSPVILFGAGIVGVASTVVLACRATLKLEGVLEETKVKLEEAQSVRVMEHPHYSESDFQQDLVIIRVRGMMSVCKLFAPAAIIGVASVAALTGSHIVLSRRSAAFAAAYKVLEKSFDDYRDRIAAKYGRETETEIYHDLEACEIDADGKKVSAVKVGKNSSSPYARFFDQHSKSWNKSPSHNQFFIQAQQSYANDLLRARGHVFLNEIYDMLGIDRSKEGAVVGWLRDGDGDGYIDFGVFRDGHMHDGKRFVDGDEGSIYLDFNVDGSIWDKI